jgi:hypothetical protein
MPERIDAPSEEDEAIWDEVWAEIRREGPISTPEGRAWEERIEREAQERRRRRERRERNEARQAQRRGRGRATQSSLFARDDEPEQYARAHDPVHDAGGEHAPAGQPLDSPACRGGGAGQPGTQGMREERTMLKFEVPNLDGLATDPEELREVAWAFELLAKYARWKAAALRQRLEGDVERAMRNERRLEHLYQELPEWARWRRNPPRPLD